MLSHSCPHVGSEAKTSKHGAHTAKDSARDSQTTRLEISLGENQDVGLCNRTHGDNNRTAC